MSDAEVRAIGDAAQTRVLERHTSARRAGEFEKAVDGASIALPQTHRETAFITCVPA